MSITDVILEAYPELDTISFFDGTIVLQDDSDGQGAYVREWNYSKPLPEGLTVGK
jgi:hypothetical protein